MTAIVGIGETGYARGFERSAEGLMLDAGRLACADAGVDPREVDGIVVCGFPAGSIDSLTAGLGARDVAFSVSMELGGAGAAASLGPATRAIASGVAEHVLVSFGWSGFSGMRLGDAAGASAAQLAELLPNPDLRRHFDQPQGLIMPMQYYTLAANRWIYEYDLAESAPAAMGEVALTARRHAHGTPTAYMRGRGLSIEDYFASPLICDPLRVLDCCLETDGASAILLGPEATARAAGHAPVRVLGVAEGRADSPDDIPNRPDLLQMGLTKAAPRAFEAAGAGPGDIGFAELYDCFTFVVLRQLEELGFCARGESPAFVRERGIGLDGGLPINTHGGLLSQGHSIGMGHVIEAVRQLRGDAGPNQLERPGLGLVTGYGDLGDGSAAILERG